jgi:hypothetical protein
MDFGLDAMDTRTMSEAGVPMTVIRIDDGGPLTVRINDKDVSVRLHLLGKDSATYRRHLNAQVRKRVDRQAKAQAAGKMVETGNVLEEADTDALDMCVACTVKWEGVVDRNGALVPCTPDAVKSLYAQFPAIREQAEAFISNRSNFLKGSGDA